MLLYYRYKTQLCWTLLLITVFLLFQTGISEAFFLFFLAGIVPGTNIIIPPETVLLMLMCASSAVIVVTLIRYLMHRSRRRRYISLRAQPAPGYYRPADTSAPIRRRLQKQHRTIDNPYEAARRVNRVRILPGSVRRMTTASVRSMAAILMHVCRQARAAALSAARVSAIAMRRSGNQANILWSATESQLWKFDAWLEKRVQGARLFIERKI